MVKGVTRRVVVIKSPDPKLFDEAIFIVREDALCDPGVTGDEILRQARETADSYVKTHFSARRFTRLSPPVLLAALSGACFASALWYLLRFVV
jgi:hypothetical protein